MNRDQIREVFLKNGFTIKDGEADLKPYVYAAAETLLNSAEVERLSAVQEASLEVAGRSDFPGYVICAEINGYGATLGDKLYTDPHPAEQKEPDSLCVEDDGCPTERAVLQRFWRKHHQPAPDVAGLVEVLEQVIKASPSGGPLWHGSEQIVEARAALAAYRKGAEK